MYSNNILEAVGNTPLVKLNRMTGPDDADIFVKFEAVGIGGSVKTRTALNMIEVAERAGKLNSDSIICEPTSGNQGIGLALVGAVALYHSDEAGYPPEDQDDDFIRLLEPPFEEIF